MSFLILYIWGNASFLLLLTAVCLPLSTLFKRRQNWRKRLASALLLTIPATVITLLYYGSSFLVPAGGTAFDMISVANYLLLFALIVAALVILFDEPFWQLLLCAVAAYASQHIVSNMILFARIAFGLNAMLASEKIQLLLVFIGIQLFITILVYTVLYFAFIRPVRKTFVSGTYTREVLYVSIMTLLAVLVLNFFRDLYSGESVAMNVICGFFSIFLCSFILLMYSSILTQNRLRAECETVTELWNRDKKQYELARDSIEMINIKCHDLRKRLDLYEERWGADKAEMESLKSSIAIYDASLKTGNTALDTILMEYLISCEKHNIRFTCIGDGLQLGFMYAEDIYSLFSNLISNAMEAVQELDDLEQRVIGLAIRPQSGVLSIRMENYFDGDLKLKNGIPVTTKVDAGSHGFGIKSMKILVERYGGILSFSQADKIFSANIIFPIPPEQDVTKK